jgi:hypothetical protein
MFKIIKMILNEIARSQILVTGGRLKTDSVVKLGCFTRSTTMTCLRIGVFHKKELDGIWASGFADIPIASIKGNFSVSAERVLELNPVSWQGDMLGLFMASDVRQIRFDLDGRPACCVWLKSLRLKPVSTIGTSEDFKKHFDPLT